MKYQLLNLRYEVQRELTSSAHVIIIGWRGENRLIDDVSKFIMMKKEALTEINFWWERVREIKGERNREKERKR